MTRRDRFGDISRVDVVLLALSLVVALWVGTRSTKDLAKTLSLTEFEVPGWSFPGVNQGKVATLRERYEATYPRSPLSWLNRNPWVERFERRAAKIQAASLSILAVASPGLGLVAIRRRRRLGGPGRAAGFIACIASSAGLISEYIMRRFNLQKYGRTHFDIDGGWFLIFMGAAIAILSAWLILVLSGRWRRGRGWREWLGRGLGAAWLVALLWQFLEPLAQLD